MLYSPDIHKNLSFSPSLKHTSLTRSLEHTSISMAESFTEKPKVARRRCGSRANGPILKLAVLFCYVLVSIKHRAHAQNNDPRINATFITDAVAKGAVCLDGSPGAYYFGEGSGDGVDNWIIFLPGGGWCRSRGDCLDRSRRGVGGGGSTNGAPPRFLDPIISPNRNTNPDFYNWNRILIRYCDGASFMADVEAVDPETNLHLRGRRIFDAVMEELMARGMGNAANALLVGNSAGGLATILHCDGFRSLIPNACRVKCFSDSGIFLHGKDLPEPNLREELFADVIAFHEIVDFLPESCTRRISPHLCLFPEYVVDDIQTPLFLLNSVFDRYQISRNFKPNPPNDVGWENCTKNFRSLQNCTANQLHCIREFGATFLKTVEGLDDDPSRGLFINSCYIHDFIDRISNWEGIPTLQNKTIPQALGDWYFERSRVEVIDSQHPYPLDCNETQFG